MTRTHLALSLFVASVHGQGIIDTSAGTEFILPADRFRALSAPLGRVRDVVVDSTGALFLSDEQNHVVFRLTPDGMLTIVAGNGIGGYSGEGGPAVNASLRSPLGLALDAEGNLFISDPADHRVRRVDSRGVIRTVAGTGRRGYAGDGDAATAASLNEPRGLALDAGGNLYIADSGNHRVRRVGRDGVIATIAGNGEARTAGDRGQAANASVNNPSAVATDRAGNVFIAETDRIRQIDAAGTITSLLSGFSISGLIVSPQGVLYFSDSGTLQHQVFRVSERTPVVVAGILRPGFSGDGGPASEASLNAPGGLAVDPAGNVYIADRDNFRLRRVDVAGIITTIAGNGQFRFSGDGLTARGATLNQPAAVAPDGRGGLLIVDVGNHRIRRVSAGGVIETIAGAGVAGYSGDGGSATSAQLNLPQGVAAGPDGSVYIADQANNRVRRVAPDGTITTFAGGGTSLGDNGPATLAQLRFPFSVAVDAAGNVLIADTLNHRIRRVDRNGNIVTIAGTGIPGFSGDGSVATGARLSGPRSVYVDAGGRILIGDTGNNRVRMVAAGTTIITTVAGGGSMPGENVAATSVLLDGPRGVTADARGNIYFAEQFAHRVRGVSPSRVITTVAGTGTAGFSGDGGPAPRAQLNSPQSVSLDEPGNLYISDAENHRIRVVLAVPPTIVASESSLTFRGEPGGLRPPPLRVTLSASAVSLPFSVAAQTESGGAWLAASPQRGSLPVSLEIVADPAGLGTGTYDGTLRISVPNARPDMLIIPVRFVVEPPAGGAALVAEPRDLSFTFVKDSRPRSQVVIVSSRVASLPFTAVAETSDDGGWLSVTPDSGMATRSGSASLRIAADPAGLAPGTYLGRVIVSAEEARQVVPVTLTISEVEQTIGLSQVGLTFTGVAGGGVVPPQTVAVLNLGQGTMNWTASARPLREGEDWIRLSGASGASDAASMNVPSVLVSTEPSNLEPGEYHAELRVTAPTALNNPQFVTTVLEILPEGSDPGPVIQPSELVFTAVEGGVSPGSRNLLVYSLRRATLSYRSRTAQADWLSYLPTDASLSGDQPARIVVQPVINGLAAGVHRGVLTLEFSGGTARRISVVLVLLAPAASDSKSLRAAQSDCVANELLPTITSLSSDFDTPAAWPTPLVVNVIDDCGKPMTSGSVIASFSSGDPPFALQSLKNGSWEGTWARTGAASGSVVVTIKAEDVDRGLRGQAQLSGNVRTSDVPLIEPGGVRNATSQAPDAPLSPGAMINIRGSSLAKGNSTGRPPLTPEINGTRVFIGGSPVPLASIGETRIEAIVPYDLAVNTRHQVFVRQGDRMSVPVTVAMASAQPGIFTQDGSGEGPGLVYNAADRLVSPENPVAAGEEILIVCSGLGPLETPVLAGTAGPDAPLARIAGALMLSIGGRNADYSFAGLAPGLAGVYHVRAKVPENVPLGPQVEVSLSVNERRSNTVTIAIR
jgi:uncharacterized protein (TIGR03437 family)